MANIRTLTVDGTTYDIKDATARADINDLKSAFDYINKKYFCKNYTSDSESIQWDNMGIQMTAGEQIIIVQNATSTYCTAYIQGHSDAGINISTIGTYTFTASFSGDLMIAHRVANVDIYYPNFNIVSEEGTSKAKAASQYLAKQISNEVAELSDDVSDLSDQLNDKYTRYKVETVQGLSLSDFAICPSQYTIVQYDGTDALQHGAITGSYIFSKLKYDDVKFKINYGLADRLFFNLAVTDSKAIALNINGTSSNVNLYTSSGISYLSGIYRNENCRNIAQGDKVHFVQNGSKIAFYLVDDGTDVPIFADEFVDVISLYGESAEISANDVGFGFTTSNGARNEPLIYDFSCVNITGDHFMQYDEVDSRLSALEEGSGYNPLKVDLIMFMGQSNMAGRGSGNQAPAVIPGAGYEFRAITDPTKLYPIAEPFGVNENDVNGINDAYGSSKMKSGDLVPAFVNAYFNHTHVSVVGVSASEGGTRISYWLPNENRYADAVARYNAAITWLNNNGYTIRHKFILWCQGESDGDIGTTKADYKTAFTTMANAWFANGIEKIFMVKIGNYNGESGYDYSTIMNAQNEICQTMPNVIMVSTDFAGMKARGLMKDDFHYQQAAYNEVGTYAGINTALYANTEKEPTMYDTQDGTLYYSHKN